MSDTTAPKTRTITLTDRRPVKIREDQWPTIAKASGDSAPSDYARGEQARARGECDTWWIRVRQHADGRAIVYASFDAAGAWTGNQSKSGGEMLDAGEDIAAAIRRVGEDVGIPDAEIRDCVAELPAEEV